MNKEKTRFGNIGNSLTRDVARKSRFNNDLKNAYQKTQNYCVQRFNDSN